MRTSDNLVTTQGQAPVSDKGQRTFRYASRLSLVKNQHSTQHRADATPPRHMALGWNDRTFRRKRDELVSSGAVRLSSGCYYHTAEERKAA